MTFEEAGCGERCFECPYPDCVVDSGEELDKKDYAKWYYENHLEERKAYIKRYRETHPEKIKTLNREYYLAHKEELLKKGKQYRRENRNKVNRNKREYYEAHKEEYQAKMRAYRARKKAEREQEAAAKSGDEGQRPDVQADRGAAQGGL